MKATLEELRGTYANAQFDLTEADPDPLVLFEKWIKEAINASCDEPNAFTLSTISENRPHSRVVLCKGLHEGKLIFYTNYLSHKGFELESNPYAAMNFLWLPLQRQIRIEGKISKVSDIMSDDYFKVRPRGSQLGAQASPQSQVMSSRQDLEQLFTNTEKEFRNIQNIPRPSHWGGYALEPDYFEFWQGRENRMHDRIAYKIDGKSWMQIRLAP